MSASKGKKGAAVVRGKPEPALQKPNTEPSDEPVYRVSHIEKSEMRHSEKKIVMC